MAPETASAGVEAVWAALVELAETGNDLGVNAQAKPTEHRAKRLGQIAADLAALAQAAAVLARHCQ